MRLLSAKGVIPKKGEFMSDIEKLIASYEGTDKLLYTDPGNPYESIYIRAKVSDGMLVVTDSECEHGPDGGWTFRTLSFDKPASEKVFIMLLEINPDPFRAMAGLFNYNDRTQVFREMCDKRGIEYKDTLSF